MSVVLKKLVFFLICLFFNNVLSLQTNITVIVDKDNDNQISPMPAKSQRQEPQKADNKNNFYVHINNEKHITFDKAFYDQDLFEEPNKVEIKKPNNGNIFCNSTDTKIDSNLQFFATYNITGKIKAMGNDTKLEILPVNAEKPLRNAFIHNKDSLSKKNTKKLKLCKNKKTKNLSTKERLSNFKVRRLDILESDLAKNYEFEQKQLKLLEKDAETKAKLDEAQDTLLKMIILKQAETLAKIKNQNSSTNCSD